MNILADESVDGPIVYRLRADGHHVLYVAEMSPGISDDVVLQAANRDDCVLLTADNDFGELVYRQRRVAWGVVLIRLAGIPAAQKADVVSAIIGRYSSRLIGAFAVISPGQTRIRHMGA